MRLVHSFCADNCADNDFNMHMWYFALSCIYAKENGFEIVLHSDRKTYNVLKNLPYDDFYIDIECIDDSTKSLYAQAKFIAMKNEPLGSIHIDGDVFLKDKKLVDILNIKDYDCIVQCLECPEKGYGYLWKESKQCFDNCDYPIWAKRECLAMYNCGVIGFNNQKLKDEYFDTYWNMIEQYKTKGKHMKYCIPDIIIEQQFLKDITDYYGSKVKILLNNEHLDAGKIGYQHVQGKIKPMFLNTIKKLVNKHNSNIYNILIDILK